MSTVLEILTLWLAVDALAFEIAMRCSGWGDE